MEKSANIKKKLKEYCGLGEIIVLCIGSDRSTGDCLGPVVGQLLTCYYDVPAFVYGTLENPVTALNLRSVIATVKKRHKGCKIIAVDSCVGNTNEIGSIRTIVGGLRPGSADGKNLPKVGHISITAVTSDQSPLTAAFASVRLGFVYELSQIIARGISVFFAERQALYTKFTKNPILYRCGKS